MKNMKGRKMKPEKPWPRAARAKVQREFSLERMLSEYEALYDRVLGTREGI
jgi:hypothetical protein